MEEIEEGRYPSTVGVIVPSEVREAGWSVKVGLFRLGGFPRAGDVAGEIQQIGGVGALPEQLLVWQSGLDIWLWCGVLPVVMLKLGGARKRQSLMGQIRRRKFLNWGG